MSALIHATRAALVFTIAVFLSFAAVAETRTAPPDLVFGDQAAVAEWAWSKAYAERFGLPPDKALLPEGLVQAVGVRIEKHQMKNFPLYQCFIDLVVSSDHELKVPDPELFTSEPFLAKLQIPGSHVRVEDRLAWGKTHDLGNLQAVFGSLHKTIGERGRYWSMFYRLYRKNYLPGLSYLSFSSGCSRFSNPSEDFEHLAYVAHNTYGAKKREQISIYKHPLSLKLKIPDAVILRLWPRIELASRYNKCQLDREELLERNVGRREPLQLCWPNEN